MLGTGLQALLDPLDGSGFHGADEILIGSESVLI